MKEKATPEALIRSKLSMTAVPGWESGWERLQPMLGEPGRRQPAAWGWRRLSLVAALAAALLAAVWWIGAMQPPPGTARQAAVPHHPPAPGHATVPGTARLRSFASRHPAPPARTGTEQPVMPSSAAVPPQAISLVPLRPLLPIPTPDTPPSMAFSLPAGESTSSLGAEPSYTRENPAAGRLSGGLHISLSLAANGGSSFGHGPRNFNPLLKGSPVDIYPAITVSKRLTPKLSLSAGLALASPVDLQRRSLQKRVSNPDRALAAGVSESEDYISISRMYYADIPLTVQYHLGPRLSVAGGLQLSVLEKVIGKTQRQDYDRWGALALTSPADPAPEVLTHAAVSDAVRPLDLRWVAGLRYQLGKRWEATLTYQHGLTPVSPLTNSPAGSIRPNQLLTTGIGFVIH